MTTAAESRPADLDLTTINVETKADAFSFESRLGETLLVAGLSAGFSLPYECSTGTCGTCHARLMEGEVDLGWPEAPAYEKLKIEKGDVLMCQARALGDCSLRVKTSVRQPQYKIRRDLTRKGVVDVVERLTRDVVHFELALSAPMDFDAGQFVTLGHRGLIGRRAYSMVNYGHDVQRLTFVIKRKPEGKFSEVAFDDAFKGVELDLIGPLGRATFHPEENRDIICIAGGSGIAGIMSILEHATQVGYFDRHRGHVFFGVRTLDDAFYLEAFAKHLFAGNGGLDVTVAISDEDTVPACHPDFEQVRLSTGMVHDVAARAIEQPWTNATGFVAGPPPMVDAAIRVLIAKAKLGADRIRFDKFS